MLHINKYTISYRAQAVCLWVLFNVHLYPGTSTSFTWIQSFLLVHGLLLSPTTWGSRLLWLTIWMA